MLKFKIKKSPEESQTTHSSTDGSTTGSSGSSTPSVELVQRAKVRVWNPAEVDLLINPLTGKKLRKTIFRMFWYLNRPRPDKKEIAQEFFQNNFPGRTASSVFQKAWRVHRRKEKRLLKKQ